MIKSFQHKGMQAFFETGSKARIQAQHAARLKLQLARLEIATSHNDMALANWRLHPLKGHLQDHWAVWVDKNWRLTFKFDGIDAVLVDYHDYH